MMHASDGCWRTLSLRVSHSSKCEAAGCFFSWTNLEYKELLSKIVSDEENRNCILHFCNTDPGKNGIDTYFIDLFNEDGFKIDDNISYKLWGHTDHSEPVSLKVSVQKFTTKISNAFDNHKVYHFIAKLQAKYLIELKEIFYNTRL